MKFYTKYKHAVPVSPTGGISQTQQEFKRDCDINVILSKYAVTGQLPNARPIRYGDFASYGDFVSCYDRINEAKDAFASVSSEIRSRFGNDPKAFFEFVLDPSNADECVRLGLREVVSKDETVLDVLKGIKDAVTSDGGNSSVSPNS